MNNSEIKYIRIQEVEGLWAKKLNNPELIWIYLANTVREKERLSEPGNPPSEWVTLRGRREPQ